MNLANDLFPLAFFRVERRLPFLPMRKKKCGSAQIRFKGMLRAPPSVFALPSKLCWCTNLPWQRAAPVSPQRRDLPFSFPPPAPLSEFEFWVSNAFYRSPLRHASVAFVWFVSL